MSLLLDPIDELVGELVELVKLSLLLWMTFFEELLLNFCVMLEEEDDMGGATAEEEDTSAGSVTLLPLDDDSTFLTDELDSFFKLPLDSNFLLDDESFTLKLDFIAPLLDEDATILFDELDFSLFDDDVFSDNSSLTQRTEFLVSFFT